MAVQIGVRGRAQLDVRPGLLAQQRNQQLAETVQTSAFRGTEGGQGGCALQRQGQGHAGGGFQAGVIFAAAFIIYALVFGLDTARRVVPGRAVRLLLAGGVLLYGGVGLISFLFGQNYLNYSVLGATQVAGQHLGILLVEFGVGMTVSAVMVSTFYAFAGQNPPISDEEW